ncbi:urokinase-type plasminogen activator [Tachyglossus aculeatus]|uniref:urokinase-type plasminogen activator n=1 Tax=Tachyglossus aculeatus TaxID=9261 RepID=UPI0018F2853B|nr:urokinase-type plasminogen activator [Tachyglossus aculeatus]
MRLLVSCQLALPLLLCAVVIGSQANHKTNLPKKACQCQNGGECVSYKLFSKIHRCNCPKGFEGEHCEIDSREQCYNGNGESYRGTAHRGEFGRQCLPWDSVNVLKMPFNASRKDALQLGLGKHNYCRNPNRKEKPWCYVQIGLRQFVRDCDVPSCSKKKQEFKCGQRRSNQYFKIVGGERMSIDSQPWIAAIYRETKGMEEFFCGGSLISACWVLSAAHCFREIKNNRYSVYLGSSNTKSKNGRHRFKVTQVILHKEYYSETLSHHNDIALLKLLSDSGDCAEPSDNIQTICLPSSNREPTPGTVCEVSGYGNEDSRNYMYSNDLKTGMVSLIPRHVCQQPSYYGSEVTKNMLCAGDPKWETDACQGDSGGPLICQDQDRMVLYGIVSWGEDCAAENKPGVYTRVSQYLLWIRNHTGINTSLYSRRGYGFL